MLLAVPLGITQCSGPDPQERARPTQAPLPHSQPKNLTVTSIGVDAKLVPIGLAKDGSLGVPAKRELNTAGWYQGSASPGEPGQAVLTGHVDSDKQRSIFFRLSELSKGDRLAVRRADGRTAHFTVDERKYVRTKDFPTGQVLDRSGSPGLWVITCAPPYDKKTHSYQSNLLVHARMTDVTGSAGRIHAKSKPGENRLSRF
ncbi:class F sortase [Streptomyces fractus]|uniref:class F sortase n=1 Tax=Streptomyces fractus TaxID=641806 RepID=UPI003CF5F70C